MFPSFHKEPYHRAEQYAKLHRKKIVRMLGWGKDGIVLETDSDTAIKALRHDLSYKKERDVYKRFRDREVDDIDGFSVPKLIDFNNGLLVVEMGIVSPPCVIDFAESRLDGLAHGKPLSEMNEYELEWLMESEKNEREMFEEKYPIVQNILSGLRRHGVHLLDVNLGNIMFPQEPDPE